MFDKDEMLDQLGSPKTNHVVDRIRGFAHLPEPLLQNLAGEALNERWGANLFVLEKYLAVHVPWSIEQGAFTQSDDQFYLSAGNLQTRYGTPLYLVFEENREDGMQPYYLTHAGSRVSAPELPTPPEIPEPPDIPQSAEIVMMHDHILGENSERVDFLAQAPPVAQMCAVSGAIQWSLNRKTQLSYWYYGKMNYLVPLYLRSREDISQAPDLIAPIQVNKESLLVRTVLNPHMPYANARVCVNRHDQLPAWLIDAWAEYSDRISEEEIEDPESAPET